MDNDNLTALEHLISESLARVDPKGTNEAMTLAMVIVSEAFQSTRRNSLPTPNLLLQRASQICEFTASPLTIQSAKQSV